MKQSNLPHDNLGTVCNYNEWDPLEEVIVGILDNAMIPPWHITMKPTMPEKMHDTYKQQGNSPFPSELIELGQKDLQEFVHILEAEGVTVRRPDPYPHDKPFSTPYWQQSCGLYSAMPRDLMLVIGNEIIETPLAWRSRYNEIFSYRRLLKEYFMNGAKWTSAPKPELLDELYVHDYEEQPGQTQFYSVVTEHEPTFDAADFIRCGKDIFGQLSHVTNRLGIEWLQRHLGDKYTVHTLAFNDIHQMHIDTTFMPLAPGKLLVHPDKVLNIPNMFKSWDVIYAPKPNLSSLHPLYMSSNWISMNIFMLDEKRVIVEKDEKNIINVFKKNGFEVIPCSFKYFNCFGGSFHCATLDIRRKGKLESYF